VVKFTLPDGYVFTSPNLGGDSAVDSDADGTTGCTPQIILEAGENDMTWDAGVYQPVVEPPVQPLPASLGDYVWFDEDEDGVQDEGESAVAGVIVELVNSCADVEPIASTVTNDAGEYLFSILQPGNYVIRFTLPAGYVFTDVNAGEDDELDSNAEPGTGCTPVINLEAGENDMSWDVGLYQPTDPTGLPDGEQPQQRALFIFLPAVQS
jgi:lysophospholipase L1-like esterase